MSGDGPATIHPYNKMGIFLHIDETKPPPDGENLGEGGQSAVLSGTSADRAQFAPEQRWTARIAYEYHGLSTGQIARLMGADGATIEALRTAEDWRVKTAAREEIATPSVTAELARETVAAIRRDLAALNREAKSGRTEDIEKRARAHLALTKSVRDLEAMVKDLEHTADAGRYPTDVVEFRSELEKRIAAIAGEGAAPRPD